MDKFDGDKYNRDLVANVLLSCPNCDREVLIEDFGNGVMITACKSEECNSKWRITIKIEEI